MNLNIVAIMVAALLHTQWPQCFRVDCYRWSEAHITLCACYGLWLA
jgi:hypothetical protein